MVIYTNTLTDYKNHSLLIFLRRTRCAAESSSPPPPAYSSSASLSHNVSRMTEVADGVFHSKSLYSIPLFLACIISAIWVEAASLETAGTGHSLLCDGLAGSSWLGRSSSNTWKCETVKIIIISYIPRLIFCKLTL